MTKSSSLGTQSSTSGKTSEEFVASLVHDFPQFKFKPGKQDYWSPGSRTITYNAHRPLSELQYGLLHELAHALLGHTNYSSDFELLKMEAAAWEKSAEIGKKYKVTISEDHIQNCLDTYRDWLHRRSTCPACGMHVLQSSAHEYKCFNCQTEWSVTNHRFVRAYRRLFKTKNT